ncbi:MAG: PaaI family thioesterase [Burkholderiales bacterium]|nr:PaaI family thioesterase [Burkholderiales bacterium]
MALTPSTADFAVRTRASFDRQAVMRLMGARLVHVAAGEIDIELPFRTDLTQQHGFLHAGVVTTLVDSACGFAAFTLMPAGAAVLTIEFKVNLLSPAKGELLIAMGRILRAGRNVTVCEGEAWMRAGDERKQVAQMLATLMTVRDSGIEG